MLRRARGSLSLRVRWGRIGARPRSSPRTHAFFSPLAVEEALPPVRMNRPSRTPRSARVHDSCRLQYYRDLARTVRYARRALSHAPLQLTTVTSPQRSSARGDKANYSPRSAPAAARLFSLPVRTKCLPPSRLGDLHDLWRRQFDSELRRSGWTSRDGEAFTIWAWREGLRAWYGIPCPRVAPTSMVRVRVPSTAMAARDCGHDAFGVSAWGATLAGGQAEDVLAAIWPGRRRTSTGARHLRRSQACA